METCVDVAAGMAGAPVNGGHLARPLLEAVSRAVGRRGAYAIQRASLTGWGTNIPWAREAPEELLDSPAPIEAYALDNADGLISIEAPREHARADGVSRPNGSDASRPGCARTSSGCSRTT